MFGRALVVAAVGAGLLLLLGCGGGDDYYKQPGGPGGGDGTLDIAGDYVAVPETFFQYLTIYYHTGNELRGKDSRGGEWSGQITNITTEETTGTGGTTVVIWVADVNLTGTIQTDNVSLVGVVDYRTLLTEDMVTITATYTNLSIGQTGDLVLLRVSRVPGSVVGGGGGDENR